MTKRANSPPYVQQNSWQDGNGYSRPKEFFITERGRHVDALLYDLLTHPSPTGEEAIMHKFLPEAKGVTKYIDATGNHFYLVGKIKEHHTMFSCHMDTVHTKAARTSLLHTDNGFVYAGYPSEKKDNTFLPAILGADDKLGMYIMITMINKKIPGVYAFHVGEEKGGIGSSAAIKSTWVQKVCTNIKRCIAFDRKGYDNIITHQRGDRCCSEDFAKALAVQLDRKMPPMIKWRPDPTGSFTDSANYTDLIPECTNLSVGYFHQHGTTEHFDWEFLERNLLPAILQVNWSELPTVREKGYSEKLQSKQYGTQTVGANRSAYDDAIRQTREAEQQKKLPLQSTYGKPPAKSISSASAFTPYNDIPLCTIESVVAALKGPYPNETGIKLSMKKTFMEKGVGDFIDMVVDILCDNEKKETPSDKEIELIQKISKLEWQAKIDAGHIDFAYEQVADYGAALDTMQKRAKELADENTALKAQVDKLAAKPKLIARIVPAQKEETK